MKALSVTGITKSGKTTTIENIIGELTRRRYSVGSIKEIHFEKFSIDTEGTNTDRHHKAGSQLVTARGYYETDILFKKKLDVKQILKFYDQDYVVMEGVEDFCVPRIITAHTVEEIEERLDETVFLISGIISNEMDEYKGIPVISSLDNCEGIVDLIEEKVCPVLPNLRTECCGECGLSCRELLGKIIAGEKRREDCPIGQSDKVKLMVNGQSIEIVPFVQSILRNIIEGVVCELDGYQSNSKIEVVIDDKTGENHETA